MKLVTLVTLLLSSFAFAQPALTRGGGLKKRVYQTYAEATYYVDPAGSDSNACTGSGTSACATVEGVINKLPRFIRHNITINIAAGTITSRLALLDRDIATGVTLTINGTMEAWTPTTGTASGTTGATSGWSSSGPSTVTDASQTWTVNDLRGRFIRFNSGTYAGESYPIISNTSDTISTTVATAVGSGISYDIVTPSRLSSTTTHTIQNVTGGGTVEVHGVEFYRSTGNTAFSQRYGATVRLDFFEVRVTTSTGTGTFISAGNFYAERSYLQTSGASVAALQCNLSLEAIGPLNCSVGNSYVRGENGYAVAVAAGVRAGGFGSRGFFEGLGTVSPILTFGTPMLVSSQLPSIIVSCVTPGSGTGIGSLVSTSTSSVTSAALTFNGSLRVENCAVGLQAVGPGSSWTASAPTFVNVTTAISVSEGARFNLLSSTPSFTGVTNELQMDGNNYTYSFLSGLTPGIITNASGSTIIE